MFSHLLNQFFTAIQGLINILTGRVFQLCSENIFPAKKSHETPFQAFLPNFIPDFFIILNKRPLFLQWPFLVSGAI